MSRLRSVGSPIAFRAMALSLLMLSPTFARTQNRVQLTRWEDPAVLVRNLGPGVEYFHLTARVQRNQGGFDPGSKYNMQVVLPGGQTETRIIPEQEVMARRLTVLVRTTAVRNLRPAQVVVRAQVFDSATGAPVSNELTASIADFPHPEIGEALTDSGPFGWGAPLSGR